MSDELEVPRPIVHAIVQGLTDWHKKIAHEGYCADGPDCLWCPAEVIAETFYRKMQDMAEVSSLSQRFVGEDVSNDCRFIAERGWRCKQRTCKVCGPINAEAIAAPILAALETEGLDLYGQLIDDEHLRAWKARVDRAGHRRKQYPAPKGTWLTFTTWDQGGSAIRFPRAALLEAYKVAITEQRRNISGSREWAVDTNQEAGSWTE